MNAVIYARYSSDSQREESIEGQLRECREYAERNNMTIVGTYIDRALSAKTADRPEFQRMIKDSAKELFEIVLVWKLDRFSRDRYDSAHYKHILKKNGVKVISAKEHISEGPEGIILEAMLEGYVSDCISKRIKANNGERNKYYIENNHPAIIDAGTFARVQEEIARRSGKPKVKQRGTKTELSRYSSKYALSELLICGECRTPYRRCTWTAKGKRKVVWRCINRLDYGKKYCHHSPSIEESLLQDAVMRAIMQTAKQNIEVLKTLKIHIGMGLTDEVTEDKTLDIQIRIAEIDAEFQKMLKAVSADNADGIDEERITELMNEKQRLTVQLEQYAAIRQKRESAKSRLDEIFTILDGLQNHPMEYDDTLVRQIIECVVVESKEKIKVVFIGGTEIEMAL